MTDVPMWVQAAVNDERRKLGKNPRLRVLAEPTEGAIRSPSVLHSVGSPCPAGL